MPYAFKIAYDGRGFQGSARQPDQRTVEGEILKGLISMGTLDHDGDGALRTASRTDRGVSALGNVVVVETKLEGEKVLKAMNGSFSREGLWFLGWAQVDSTFQPRKAIERWYRYMYPVPPGPEPGKSMIDIDGMKEASRCFIGEHDFSAFSKVDRRKYLRSPLRNINNIEVAQITVSLGSTVHGKAPVGFKIPFEQPLFQDLVIIDVRGQSFLWQMVRRICAAIVAVGKIGNSKASVEGIEEILANKRRNNLGVLPPQNLILMDVAHSIDYHFENDKKHVLTSLHHRNAWPLIDEGMFYGQLMDRILDPALR